jgi:hypothetical protein
MARSTAAQSMSEDEPTRRATTNVKAERIGSNSKERVLPEVLLSMVAYSYDVF